MNHLLFQQWREQFNQQGYALLKNFLALETLEAARRDLAKLVEQQAEKLLATGKITDPLKDEPFETRLYRLYENCLDDAPTSFRPELHLAELFDVFFHPRLLDFVETILGDEIRLYPNYTARPKLPEWKGTEVLWHQDGGYTKGAVERLRMVNVWTPLVPARVANGCMEFIPGTHTLGVVPHEERRYYLEIAPEHLQPRLPQAVPIEMDPTDVVIFHNLLFHRGLPNHSQTIRWSLDWRYQDATQPTLRTHHGHVARSRCRPERAVKSAEEWARLTFV
jgi:ectoine hydroxylase-related dioxygenase (phytanoyl-CoA dioxygenase family)